MRAVQLLVEIYETKWEKMEEGEKIVAYAKKSEENSSEMHKKTLTKQKEWCTMEVHTVIVCPSVPILIYEDIITQKHGVVKSQVRRKRQRILAYQKHTIRKKGCDDPYGNGP